MTMTYRLLLADDHDVFLDGVVARLKPYPQFEIVGRAADGPETLALVEQQQPDFILLDISMPQVRGTELVTTLRARYPQLKIIIYSQYGDLPLVATCLAAGVEGYVLKGDPDISLATVLNQVINGHLFLSPSLCRPLAEHSLRDLRTAPAGSASWNKLTPRAREILSLSAQGLSSKEVAHRLGLSPKTISNRLLRLRQQLHLKTKAELIRYVQDNEPQGNESISEEE